MHTYQVQQFGLNKRFDSPYFAILLFCSVFKFNFNLVYIFPNLIPWSIQKTASQNTFTHLKSHAAFQKRFLGLAG
jgi:hypothetical protein